MIRSPAVVLHSCIRIEYRENLINMYVGQFDRFVLNVNKILDLDPMPVSIATIEQSNVRVQGDDDNKLHAHNTIH